ncbi:zinc ribbon domain-containing protein [Leptolinea tardivitalis]|uniref:AraC family transcriptional regulator n=1 Tax=Leptolinea tardivitalis TaxID=229920 RepID=A0A0P6WP91_9CHLR|nr:zinc ribbon domain-containing protein [Leptolinea tardivitalis]KPL71871.1 AraC family transcriptional regulator [Leptolinea tardivitalis]GAP20273.1 protein containing putative zinc ribbon domain [Leptolinea tardivitalis]
MKVCISCGMPMNSPEDFPLGDVSKDYCIHCARPDGSMQSFDEKLQGTTEFIIRTQGFDAKVARESARAMLSRQPAWKSVSQ